MNFERDHLCRKSSQKGKKKQFKSNSNSNTLSPVPGTKTKAPGEPGQFTEAQRPRVGRATEDSVLMLLKGPSRSLHALVTALSLHISL